MRKVLTAKYVQNIAKIGVLRVIFMKTQHIVVFMQKQGYL